MLEYKRYYNSMSKEWFFQIIQHEGRAVDAYVSNKMRQIKQSKFGFVRFETKEEAVKAVKRNDDLGVKGFEDEGLVIKVSEKRKGEYKVCMKEYNGSSKDT